MEALVVALGETEVYITFSYKNFNFAILKWRGREMALIFPLKNTKLNLHKCYLILKRFASNSEFLLTKKLS